MTDDALILIGRDGTDAPAILRTHARRLRERGAADAVHVATYGPEPVRDLAEQFRSVTADRVFALPARVAHTRATTDDLPAALSYVPGEVRYCEPIGQSPAVTSLVVERASEHAAGEDATLVLVGLGHSSQPYHRQAAEYQAARLTERSAYADVVTCYLLQNPTVECVRYNVATERAVAVPLFVAGGDATDKRIPAKLELDRGGIAYADPLGEHPLVTDAFEAELQKQRALAMGRGGDPLTFEGALARHRRPVATDGEGDVRPS